MPIARVTARVPERGLDDLQRGGEAILVDRLLRTVVDAGGIGDEQHRGGDDPSDRAGVVAGEGRRGGAADAGLVGGPLERRNQSIVHRDAGDRSKRLDGDLRARGRRGSGGELLEPRLRVGEDVGVGGAEVDDDIDAAGNRVRRVRVNVETPDGERDDVAARLELRPQRVGRDDERRRRLQRVAPAAACVRS